MGNISVTANVAPAAVANVCRLALAGDRLAAERENARLDALNSALFLESNPIPVKWVLHKLGLIEPGIRLPLTWLDEMHTGPLAVAMARAGL